MTKYDVVSFLSDMGTSDESVGVCKAIIYQQAPHVKIIDISHDVAAFDVRAGALALTRAIQFLPNGVVLAAVDPGSPRDQRYIAVEMEEGVLIGPDNGILAPAAQLIGQPKRVVEITNIEYRIDAPGHVFAARDILAPAAGVIASGTDLSVLGAEIPLEQLVPGMLQLSRHDEGGAFVGEVWSLDRFGNIQVNITPEEIATKNVKHGDTLTIRVANKDFMAKYVERYADLGVSQLGILVDSTGMISIVKNLDFAARELEVKEGKEIIILPAGTSVTGRDVTVDVMSLHSDEADNDDGGDIGSALNLVPLAEDQPQTPQQIQPQVEDPYTPAPTIEPQVPSAPPQVFVTPQVQVDPSMPPDPFAMAPSSTPNPQEYIPQFDQSQTHAVSAEPNAQVPQSPSVMPPQTVAPQNPTQQQYGDGPSYFPPPVEQPSTPTPDVAPAYEYKGDVQSSESASSLPQNVFDLFKNPDDEETDPNHTPQP